MPTHYDVLNVSPAAEPLVIEAAYKALLKRYHPDVNLQDSGDAEAATRDIIAAYQVLRDPKTRAAYDQELANATGASAQADAPTPAPPEPSIAPSRQTSKGLSSWLFIGLACLVLIGGLRALGVGRITPSVSPGLASISDAKSAPPPLSAEGADKLVNWSEADTPGVAHYRLGGLQLTLSGRTVQEGRQTVLTVQAPNDATPFEVTASPGLDVAMAEVGVGRIDPASPVPQVLFTTYTGGAHCCADIRLVEQLNGAWRVTQIAIQDGDRLGKFPQDLDGDGRREIELTDDAFLYAFTAYADSYAPPRLVTVNDGRIKDVSAEARFRPVYVAYISQVQGPCEQHSNGACAAYAAAAARTGQLDEVWPKVLASYDPKSDWILPSACGMDITDGSPCPEGKEIQFSTYPEALRWFLGEQGYIPPVYVPKAGATGPSFSCERADTPTLSLICATPQLAEADRELAVAYNRALALSSDPAQLRQAQRQFLAERTKTAAEVEPLLHLYAARIFALEVQ